MRKLGDKNVGNSHPAMDFIDSTSPFMPHIVRGCIFNKQLEIK